MSVPGLLDEQRTLIDALRSEWRRQGQTAQCFETHISWVLVAGGLAYKFKKAVRFDFLDFCTLEARHFYCDEELRLNRRLAPDIYLDVVSITGSFAHPTLEQAGVPIEYAVKMHAFPQEALWSHRIANQLITPREIDDLAEMLAAFHRGLLPTSPAKPWGAAHALHRIAQENLSSIADQMKEQGLDDGGCMQVLQNWEMESRVRLNGTFGRRKTQGFIRECHGDLHGGNILTLNGRVQAFDCIEFNDAMRWIDVINDIAFISMDLRAQGRRDLSARLLDRYLQLTGDYEGLALLRYYEVQRALVRCKVAFLRAQQARGETAETAAQAVDSGAAEATGKRYLDFAMESVGPARGALILMHGYSGSGKSTLAAHLVESIGAIRLRSDVERKRMHGLDARTRGRFSPGTGILESGLYDSISTRATYARLSALAAQVVRAGYPVIVDAAFLKTEQRALFWDLAARLEVPFVILDVRARESTLKARVSARAMLGQDPSDAGLEVLVHQLASAEHLSRQEQRRAIAVDFDRGVDATALERINASLRRILMAVPEHGEHGSDNSVGSAQSKLDYGERT